MKSIEPELVQVIEAVWSSTLMLPVELAECSGLESCLATLVGARIDVLGDHPSTVVLECSEAMARAVAGCMFGIAPDQTSDDDMNDAVGELLNIIGGNIHGLLSETSTLGLPTASRGSVDEAGEIVDAVHFESSGMPFHIVVKELSDD